jgi:hypothetical protein
MNTYKINYRYNGGCTVTGVVDEAYVSRIKSEPRHIIVSLVPYTPVIKYQTVEGCSRCLTDEYVRHYQCHYNGTPAGHSEAHCTADGCY